MGARMPSDMVAVFVFSCLEGISIAKLSSIPSTYLALSPFLDCPFPFVGRSRSPDDQHPAVVPPHRRPATNKLSFAPPPDDLLAGPYVPTD